MKLIAPALALMVLASGSTLAADFQEGVHYRRLPNPQPTGVSPGQVEILEFFSWGCPACNNFEPYLELGVIKKLPPRTVFNRVPAAFNPAFKPLARAYYVAESLKVLDQVNKPMFSEMHDLTRGGEVRRALGELVSSEQRRDKDAIAKAEQAFTAALAGFFARHAKVKEADFHDAWKSFAVSAKMQRGDALYRRYQINGVPGVIVDGKYFVGGNSGLKLDSYPQYAEIVRWLAAREAAAAR